MPNTKQVPINNYQIKMIHTLKNALGMDELTYRSALFEAFGVYSSKDLTSSEAGEVISYFEREATDAGLWKKIDPKEKYRKLEGRPDYATVKQLAYIESLWKQVSRVKGKQRASALRSFLQRQAGVSDLRFLKRSDTGKVVTALKAMKHQTGK